MTTTETTETPEATEEVEVTEVEEITEKRPLWLLIEEGLLAQGAEAFSGGEKEASIKQVAGELDNSGYNVSRHGGNMLELRWAVDEMLKVGRPLMTDVNASLSALSLDDVEDAHLAATTILDNIGTTWPKLRTPKCRGDVVAMVHQTRLDLLIANAKGMDGDQGIRYLIGAEVADEVIIDAMEITEEKIKEVHDLIAAELAERKRVEGLLEKVADKTNPEKVKFLFENDVAEDLTLEMAGVSQGDIDAAKKAMEEELAEKQRLAEEEAARKKAEAEGPSIESIPPEDLLNFIESIREIMEFSEEEKDIRMMCEQSAIPKALVDIAVSEPAKLDELEQKAQG